MCITHLDVHVLFACTKLVLMCITHSDVCNSDVHAWHVTSVRVLQIHQLLAMSATSDSTSSACSRVSGARELVEQAVKFLDGSAARDPSTQSLS